MCRLFGFRSVIKSNVHSSLLEADNALLHQSVQHPDGWGVAYYLDDVPHVIKSVESAVSDSLFKRVGGLVASETVLAHLRKATLGKVNVVNTHPFQYGRWIFAHNGNIKDFSKHRDKIFAIIDPSLSKYVLGESDSELLFFCLLSKIKNLIPLDAVDIPAPMIGTATRSLMAELKAIIGPFNEVVASPQDTYLTFIITNGMTMLGFQGGQDLNYSTYKSLCPEREDCAFFGTNCESEDPRGIINHLVLASERLEGANIFHPMKPGDIVGVDRRMIIYRDKL